MKNWQKRLVTIAICEAWGLVTLALLFWGGSWLGDGEVPNTLGVICGISCAFVGKIDHELFYIAPYLSVFPVTFLIQFGIYAILGLFFSIFVCRKTAKQQNK